MSENTNWETIVELGAEGGRIKLQGCKDQKGIWTFKISENEIAYEDIDDDDDNLSEGGMVEELQPIKPTFPSPLDIATTWEGALKLLDCYPWHTMNPRNVHHSFSDKIWEEIRSQDVVGYKLVRWAKACYPKLFQLGKMMKASEHTVILTGAGMSTESGVPDFRSESGWWKSIDPRTVATIEALDENYDLFHEFYSNRVNALKECGPHKGHMILADWQSRGIISSIATQNVDNLHQMAGASDVQTLHGSIGSFRCQNCGKNCDETAFLQKEKCLVCGGKIRPEVVLFGEILPETTWNTTIQNIRRADLVLVIGTSLEVYPVNVLPSMTSGKTVLINFDEIKGDYQFDLIVQGKAGIIFEKVDELLKIFNT